MGQDVINNIEDNGVSVEATVSGIRRELLDNACDPARTFLISAKHPECAYLDFGLLLRAMALDVSRIRGALPEFQKEGMLTLTTSGVLPEPDTTLEKHRGAAAAAAAAAAAEAKLTTGTKTNIAARRSGQSFSQTAFPPYQGSRAVESEFEVGSTISASGDLVSGTYEDTQNLFLRFICL